MLKIKITNMIEVHDGGMITVPGAEPASEISSTQSPVIGPYDKRTRWPGAGTLSYMPVTKALSVIPGSYLAYSYNPKRKWFVFPDWPDQPGCECPESCPDYQQILRDNAEVPADEEVCGNSGLVTTEVCIDDIIDVFPMDASCDKC